MVDREEQCWLRGRLGETVWAGGKLQDGEEGLRPGGPQIPPGLGSLDSVGGGGGRGLSGPEAGGGAEAKDGGLAPGSWPSRPPMGEGAGLGQGPAPGLGPAGHGAASYSPRCLPLSLPPFSLNPDLALLSALSAPTLSGTEAMPGFRTQAVSPPGLPIPTRSGSKPPCSEERTPPKHMPPSPAEGGRRS